MLNDNKLLPTVVYADSGAAPKKPDHIRLVCVGNIFGEYENIPSGDIYINTGNFIGHTADSLVKFLDYLNRIDGYKVIIGGVYERPFIGDIINVFSNDETIFLNGMITLMCGLRIHNASIIGDNGELFFKQFNCYNDIVVSHIPPRGILDKNFSGANTGSRRLRKNLELFPPRVCVFSGSAAETGTVYYKNILCINASIYSGDHDNNRFLRIGSAIVIDVPR